MLPVDPAFGVSSFGESKVYSETETLANNILAILFGKPGSIPTMPNAGMYIQDLVMQLEDDINTDEIKATLVNQCSDFKSVVNNGEFEVVKKTFTDPKTGLLTPLLLIVIPTQIKKISRSLVIGIRKNGNTISYNFSWVDT